MSGGGGIARMNQNPTDLGIQKIQIRPDFCSCYKIASQGFDIVQCVIRGDAMQSVASAITPSWLQDSSEAGWNARPRVCESDETCAAP
jgi:hypothetical protein